MYQPVIDMERILQEENELYETIYMLEGKKSKAILDKDGIGLEKIVKEQEALLHAVSLLEEARERKIEEYRKVNNLDEISHNPSLRDIIISMDEDSAHRILLLGMELKEKLMKLADLRDVNAQMLKDNMEFYDILISSLKDSSSIKAGYSEKGVEDEKVSGPVLFNQSV